MVSTRCSICRKTESLWTPEVDGPLPRDVPGGPFGDLPPCPRASHPGALFFPLLDEDGRCPRVSTGVQLALVPLEPGCEERYDEGLDPLVDPRDLSFAVGLLSGLLEEAGQLVEFIF